MGPCVELGEPGVSHPCHARERRITHLITITTIHPFRGCKDAALVSCQHRDAGHLSTAAARHAATSRGRGTPKSPSAQADPSPYQSWRAVGVAPGQVIAARNRPNGPDVGVRTRRHGAHRRSARPPSPDLPNPQMQGPIAWGPTSNDPKGPVSARIWCRCPFLTRVPQCGRCHCQSECLFRVSNTARGGAKHNSYHVRGASSMLPHVSHTISFFLPCPSTCHHLTPSRTRIRRERAPPPNGAPPTSALNP